MIGECYVGDVRAGLVKMIREGIRAQTCVTSPPYWGLRDYGVKGQIGLEPTLAEYLETMVAVFNLVREMLQPDGTLWVNMGDSYAASGKGGDVGGKSTLQGGQGTQEASRNGHDSHNMALSASSFRRDRAHTGGIKHARTPGAKPKDLLGQPWRLAFALQDAGWFLRSDIIWHKPNPMPESAGDRPTKSHEYIFLLAKQRYYYYDSDAIVEPVSADTHARYARANSGLDHHPKPVAGWAEGATDHSAVAHSRPKAWDKDMGSNRTLIAKQPRKGNGVGFGHGYDKEPKPRVKDNESFHAAMAEMPQLRNKRSVWTVPTHSFKDAHFATFPPALIEPCILAGSRPGDVVLDPFMGSGTTAMVAQSLARRWIGCELNPEYIAMQRDRARQVGLVL